MIRISKLRKVLTDVPVFKLYRSYATKKHFQWASADEDPYDKLPAEIRPKILYSSFLEAQKAIMGFKGKKVFEDQREKEKQRLDLSKVEFRSFPVSLKAFQGDQDTQNVEKVDRSVEEDGEYVDEYAIAEKELTSTPPGDWMNDYEFYEKSVDEDGEINSKYGTPDPSIPASNVPCNGCGAHLHCANPGIPGYIPSEIYRGRTKNELKQIICQRCHFLKTYNIALDVEVTPETYIKTLSAIKDKFALAVLIVDLLDFPCSIWPGMQTILGDKRPIFIVGNKVDLLPMDSPGYLDHIKRCLQEEVTKSGLSKMNIKNISLISAKTGYGIEEFITKLQKVWVHKGDVYLVGCTNVGKSSLFNILLNSDYCKAAASDLVRKATTCPWPGTTLQMLKFPIQRPSDYYVFHRSRRLFSERGQREAERKLRRAQANETGSVKWGTLVGHIGRTVISDKDTNDPFSMATSTQPIQTLDENSRYYANCHWCFDTPGVMQPAQIHNLLTTEELLKIFPTQMISPRGYRIKPGMTLFLAGLARIDFIEADIDSMRLPIYCSHKLPIVITPTEHADSVYADYLGSELFGLPLGDENRLKTWPGLQCSDNITITGESEDAATCDILLSSAGWIGLRIPLDRYCTFKIWTPEKRGIVIRKPSLIPYGDQLCGKRIRGSIAYRKGKPFVKTRK